MNKTVTFLEISLYAQHSPRRLYGATFNRNGRYPIHEWDHPHIFWRFWGAHSPTPCVDLVKDWHLRVAEQWKIWIQSVEDKGTKKRFSPITPMFKKFQPPPPDPNKSIDSKKGRRRILAQCLCSAEICCGTVIPCHRYVWPEQTKERKTYSKLSILPLWYYVPW